MKSPWARLARSGWCAGVELVIIGAKSRGRERDS